MYHWFCNLRQTLKHPFPYPTKRFPPPSISVPISILGEQLLEQGCSPPAMLTQEPEEINVLFRHFDKTHCILFFHCSYSGPHNGIWSKTTTSNIGHFRVANQDLLNLEHLK